MDVPLLVEWPDGRREALLFVLEEETDTSRFSIHRLAHYCLDLGELFQTDRVAPVVIFLRGTAPRYRLEVGDERHRSLDTVVGAFCDGATAEEIAEEYPALSLARVYATVAYYLAHTA